MDTPLQKLIAKQKETRRMSYADIARASGLPRATVYSLAVKTFKSPPRSDTLEKLAVGIGVPAETLLEAAAQSSGYFQYEETTDSELRLLLSSVSELSPESRSQIKALVDAMLTSEQKMNFDRKNRRKN